jgi:molecular chaperone DnaJ
VHNDIDRDLYEILGVNRSASQSDIKTAYRQKARECHPDVAHDDPDGELKFKELTFAYEILSDPEKRRDYDMYGLDGLRRGAGIDFNGFGSISDLFDLFFGGGFGDPFAARGSGRGRVRGRDMEILVTITLKDVVTGVDKEVEVHRHATCQECGGTGMKPGTHMSSCDTCDGVGQVRSSRRSILGTLVSSRTCPKCEGAGQIITDPCESCGGVGLTAATEKIQVPIPPGVDRGDRLRLGGKGEGGVRGGSTGDLYVLIDVEPDPRFERDGIDLHTSITVDFTEAALGSQVEMESIDGGFSLKVPGGTQPGRILKAKGKGLPPRYGGRRGDMLVKVDVSIPSKLTARQKTLLESFSETRKETGKK